VRVQEDRGGGPFVRSSQELHEELRGYYLAYRGAPVPVNEYTRGLWIEIEAAEAREGVER
jgi:hypothetical protein